MSVSEIGKVPTRVFKYGEGRERTVRLTADLRLRMQDIASRTNDGEILSGEAARLSCLACFGQSFWDKIPYGMAADATNFAIEVMKEILGIEDDEEDSGGGDGETPGEETAEDPGADSKNEDAPPGGG